MPRFSKERKAEIDAAIKKKVFDAVARILEKKNTAKISIRMLTAETGIATGTLYNHFRTKDEIAVYVVKQVLTPIELRQIEIVESDMSVLDKLRSIIRSRITRNVKLLEMVVMMTGNMAVPNSLPALVFKSSRKRIMNQLESVIADGVQQGLLRDIDMKFLASDFLAVARSKNIPNEVLSGRDEQTVEQDVEETLDMFMYGTAVQRQRTLPGMERSYAAVIEDTPKDRIFAAVVSMLKDCSLDNLSLDLISMSTIARRAGISKVKLYEYFTNKDDLFAYILCKSLEPHINAKMECVQSNISISEKLMAFAAAEINKNDNMKRINNMALWNKCAVSYRQVGAEFRQRSHECLVAILRQGLREGFFRKIREYDLISFFKYLTLVFLGYQTYYKKKKRIATDSSMIVDLFLNGAAERS